ncbi:MAG: 2-amino-4-hydroxy-6-hydroxymethyldihydropteridine diphosphokinase [Candidatus Limnocylindrales bacterium]
MSPLAYIGLGANLGDRVATLSQAVTALGGLGRVDAVSRLWETAPMHVLDQPAFLNAVAAVEIAAAAPGEIVGALQRIERDLGRTASRRFGPRAIDLDLLLIAGERAIARDGDVVVPHPRLAERRFVLAPLSELAPDAIDPRSGRRIGDLLQAVAKQAATVVGEAGWWKTASS